jgi:hypothetical protein
LNGEGKYFPQKIISIAENALVTRKFNFFSENIVSTRAVIGSEAVYSVGINGVVSKIHKRDIGRLVVK